MWIILFLVCFYETTSSLAQELTSFEYQPAVDSSEANQGVKWDSTRPPVTLSIRSGRSGRLNRTQDVSYDDDRKLYSNEWQPILMPIRSNNQRDDRNAYFPNYQFPPTFLRRPDSDVNRTVLSEPLNPTVNGRDIIPPASVPMAPFMFYPPPLSFYPYASNQVSNKNVLQNSSTLAPERPVSESETTIPDENQSETSQTETFPVTFDISRRFFPGNSYGNAEGILPPRSSYPPNQFLPYPVIPPFQPIFNPNFNQQIGIGDISPPGVSQTDSENGPDSDRNRDLNLEDNTPGEAPSAPLPFPAGGYPYGLMGGYPLPFAPQFLPNVPLSRGRSVVPSGPLSRDPFIANFPPRGVPLSPFIPPPPNTLPDPQVSGELLPPPIVEANPPLEPEGIIPQVADLRPELEAPVELQAETEAILKSEGQAASNAPFEFGYDMNDGQGNLQHRKEVSNGGVTTGSYGFRDLYGIYRLVNYIADKGGFRVFIKSNEPGIASGGSADVVVMAESPPPNAIIESLKASEPQAVVVPDEADLIAAGSEPGSK